MGLVSTSRPWPTPVSQLTSSHRVRGVLVLGEIVQDGGLAAAPWAHEQDQWLRKDFRITKVTVAEVAVLVQRFEWLDCRIVGFLQIAQNNIGHLVQGGLLIRGLIVDIEELVNVRGISTVRRDFVLLVRHEEHTNKKRDIRRTDVRQINRYY